VHILHSQKRRTGVRLSSFSIWSVRAEGRQICNEQALSQDNYESLFVGDEVEGEGGEGGEGGLGSEGDVVALCCRTLNN